MMQKKKDEMAELKILVFKYLKQWKWFVLSVFCCVALAFVFLKITPKIYQVNAYVLIKQDDSGSKPSSAAVAARNSFSLGFPGSMDVEDELHIMGSYSLLLQVVKDLKLNEYYSQKGFLRSYDRFENSAFRIKASQDMLDSFEEFLKIDLSVSKKGLASVKVKDSKGVIFKAKDKSFPVMVNTPYGDFEIITTSYYKPDHSYSYKMALAGYGMTAERYYDDLGIGLASKKSNVIALSLKDVNFKKSELILNTIIDYYNQDALDEKRIVAESTSKFLGERLSVISVELADVEERVEKYKKANAIFNMELESKAMLDQNNDIQTQLVKVSTQ